MHFSTLAEAARQRVYGELGGCRAAARALKVSPAFISRLCNGKRKNPSPALLKKLRIKEYRTYEVL